MNEDEQEILKEALLKEALSLLETYREELDRMVEHDQFYAHFIRRDELASLYDRHDNLLEDCKGGQQ